MEIGGDFDDDNKLYDGGTEIMWSKIRQEILVVDSQPPSLLLQTFPTENRLRLSKAMAYLLQLAQAAY